MRKNLAMKTLSEYVLQVILQDVIHNNLPQDGTTDVEGLEEYILGLPVQEFTRIVNNGVASGVKGSAHSLDEEMNLITSHPSYLIKEEFYRMHQFSYLPREAETQTNIKSSNNFSVQIEDGRQWNRFPGSLSKSFNDPTYNKIEVWDEDSEDEDFALASIHERSINYKFHKKLEHQLMKPILRENQ